MSTFPADTSTIQMILAIGWLFAFVMQVIVYFMLINLVRVLRDSAVIVTRKAQGFCDRDSQICFSGSASVIDEKAGPIGTNSTSPVEKS